jgi:threonine/homoserine/homoserine lactone efflux protein
MTLNDIASYFVTLVAIELAPGPIFLMLMVRAAGSDLRGAIAFAFGAALGGLVIITVVCVGLSAWLTSVPEIFDYSKYVMMAYILWVARGIWKSGFDLTGEGKVVRGGIVSSVFAGLVTSFISPYMMILFPLVLTDLMDISTIAMPSFLIVAVTTFLALSFGSGLIIAFAAQLRRFVRSPQNVVRVNRALSAFLVVGGSWMAFG